MPFKPPLTTAQLKEIQERRKDDPDVLALLWEVARQRALILRGYQLTQTLGDHHDLATMTVLEVFREELKDDPVVIERVTQVAELFGKK